MEEMTNPYYKLHYIIELTEACNNSCHYCYNVWKLEGHKKEKRKELSMEEWKFAIDKLHRETSCICITLSGGEPTLREDFLEILYYIHSKHIEPMLITNGSNLSSGLIHACMERGVRVFEVPLLGPSREIHNEIAGNDCWDKIIEGVVEIRAYGGRPVVVFVATKKNLPFFEETLKLAIAIESDSMMLNRFNAGGEGFRYIDSLMPDVEEFEKAMDIANTYSQQYRYMISSSIPVQPCLIDVNKYPYIRAGFCAAGTDSGYFTIGPDGLMRPCNHSSRILGNFLTEKFEDIIKKPEVKEFKTAFPNICGPCPHVAFCQGGCKAAAEVCYGSVKGLDPFLKRNLERQKKFLSVTVEQ